MKHEAYKNLKAREGTKAKALEEMTKQAEIYLEQRNELLEALQTTLANYKRQLHINNRDDINNCIPLAEKAIQKI